MPNAYNVKNLAQRAGRSTKPFHQAYYFFNSNATRRIPAFITTPDLYYMNRTLTQSRNNGQIRQRLINLTGGEARARRVVTNALIARQRCFSTNRACKTQGHEHQIRFFEKLQKALGAGPMTNRGHIPNGNYRRYVQLEQLIKTRMAKNLFRNQGRYNQVKRKQNLLMNHIRTSTNLANQLNRFPPNVRNNPEIMNTLKYTNRNLKNAILRFLQTRALMT